MSNPFDQVANLIAQAANTVSVLANETVEVPNSNINFNNTATVNVSVYANPSRADRANVEFSVNTSAVVFVGPAGPQGNTGNTGATGNTGPQGPAGNSAVTIKAFLTSNVRLNVATSGAASNAYLVSIFVPANTITDNTITSITAGLMLYDGFSNQPTFGIHFLPEVVFQVFWGANGNSADPVIFSSKVYNEYDTDSSGNIDTGIILSPIPISQQLFLFFSGGSVHLLSGVTSAPAPQLVMPATRVDIGHFQATTIQPVLANAVNTAVDAYLGFGVGIISNVSPTIVTNAVANIVSTIIALQS